MMKEQTLYEKHLKAIDDNMQGLTTLLVGDKDKAALACETITKETAMSFAEWIEGKYQKFYEKWTERCNDVYSTTNEFYTTSELFNLYLSNAGETNQELKEKG